MVGISEDEVEALERGVVDDAPFSEEDQVLLSLVRVIVARDRADDHLFAAVRRVLSDRELVELHLLVGIYAVLAALMIDLDLDLDTQLGVELLDSGPRGP